MALATAALACPMTTARAETGVPGGTVQAAAADALFLQYAPPPPGGPGVVCLVDSGVNPNPDTTPILAGSYALYPYTDTADEFSRADTPFDGHPSEHGTLMAELMAAPANGYGIVGLAPTSVRVLNIKALPPGQVAFPVGAYSAAISACSEGPTRPTVVSLSLGGETQLSASERLDLTDSIAHTQRLGGSVVAAAGNGSGSVLYPAALPGVVAVGASDANPSNQGALCPSSARGPELRVLAPGCDTLTASGQGSGIDASFADGSPEVVSGTSESTALVAAALASMRAYAPQLTYAQAESCIARTRVDGGNLDVAAAFAGCGLSAVVEAGSDAYRAASSGPSPSPAPAPTNSALGEPRIVRVQVRGPSVSVDFAPIPPGAEVRVRAFRVSSRRHSAILLARASAFKPHVRLRARSWTELRAQLTLGSARSRVVKFRRGSR